MKISRTEKLEQEHQVTRQGFVEDFMKSFEMSKKEADEYIDVIEVFCAQFINNYMRRKRSS